MKTSILNARTVSIVRDLRVEKRQGANGEFESKDILFRIAVDRDYKVTRHRMVKLFLSVLLISGLQRLQVMLLRFSQTIAQQLRKMVSLFQDIFFFLVTLRIIRIQEMLRLRFSLR